MTQLTLPPNEKDHVYGNLSAPVHLLEYGDYECPYCGEAYWVIKKIISLKGDDMAFIFRNFPLTQSHPHALPAAKAAEAAGKQDQFWYMHDTLYENQAYLSDDDLFDYAKEMDLNMQKFKRDFHSASIAKKIEEDIESGIYSGVNGTPTFFINGNRYDGTYDLDTLLSAINNTT